MTATKWMKGFRFGIILHIKHGLLGIMQVYGLVGQTSEGICPSAALRVIYLPQSDQSVRKLAYCPQGHVLFVRQTLSFVVKS
jgi:hypothetical protein